MKTLLLITLIHLLQSFPVFANVNGKGIICECTNCKLDHIDPSSYIQNNKPSEIGFHFKNDKVAIYFLSKIGDTIKLSENIDISLRKKKKYYISEEEIRWTYRDSLNVYSYILDRKTLSLIKNNITNTETHNFRQCSAYPEKKFFENMNQLSFKHQDNYKKNSINKI